MDSEISKQDGSHGDGAVRSMKCSAATPYQVRCRQSDNRYCIYLRDYAVVIGELNKNITNADLTAIKEIFDGKMPPNSKPSDPASTT